VVGFWYRKAWSWIGWAFGCEHGKLVVDVDAMGVLCLLRDWEGAWKVWEVES
jgi:hypothetical protein